MYNKTATDTTREVLKRMIILCWVILAVCFVVKIFGGNFFNIVVNNERFIKVCNFIESNIFLYFLVSFIFNFSFSMLFILSVDSRLKPSKFQLIYILLLSFIVSLLKITFVLNNYYYITSIIDVLHIIMFIFAVKRKSNLICASIQYIIFMVLSNFTKGFSLNISNEPILFSLVMSIDVIIMLSLLFLYSNKNGDIFMGVLFIFLSKDIEQLEAYKATLKDPKKIAKVEERIAKLKEKREKKEEK